MVNYRYLCLEYYLDIKGKIFDRDVAGGLEHSMTQPSHLWMKKKLFNIKIKLWSPSQCALQWHWCWWWLCCIGRQRWKLSIQADMFLKKIFSTRICVLLVVKNHIRSPNLLKRKTDIPHSPKIWTRKWFYGAFGKPVYFIKFYMAIKFWNLK